ncbi:hypothetical protein F5Y19DRAFT_117226 [Xylariaceae sp. FL1651]|nr:hypothetical protein F5Y19DRAFT_117226 [Xylariaceae sp. FL1651]
MPVTELAWIPSVTRGSVPPALIEASRRGMEAQSEWAAKHASSTLPSGPPHVRGAALYQQREDPGLVLLTAHWDAVAQHYECISAEENKRAMQALAPLVVFSGIKFLHIEGVKMLPEATLEAGLLSVVRMSVSAGRKAEVEKAWGDVKGLIRDKAGFEHVVGWRIEKEEGKEDREEFVVVGAWSEEAELGLFGEGKWQNASAWDEAWKGIALDTDIKTYRRLV